LEGRKGSRDTRKCREKEEADSSKRGDKTTFWLQKKKKPNVMNGSLRKQPDKKQRGGMQTAARP